MPYLNILAVLHIVQYYSQNVGMAFQRHDHVNKLGVSVAPDLERNVELLVHIQTVKCRLFSLLANTC